VDVLLEMIACLMALDSGSERASWIQEPCPRGGITNYNARQPTWRWGFLVGWGYAWSSALIGPIPWLFGLPGRAIAHREFGWPITATLGASS